MNSLGRVRHLYEEIRQSGPAIFHKSESEFVRNNKRLRTNPGQKTSEILQLIFEMTLSKLI